MTQITGKSLQSKTPKYSINNESSKPHILEENNNELSAFSLTNNIDLLISK